jgi:hypothetical protein
MDPLLTIPDPNANRALMAASLVAPSINIAALSLAAIFFIPTQISPPPPHMGSCTTTVDFSFLLLDARASPDGRWMKGHDRVHGQHASEPRGVLAGDGTLDG